MEFGFNFFPDVSPQVKSGQQYFREALSLIELGERYGYTGFAQKVRSEI